MRTTVDIPDAVYRQLKAKAALEGLPVKDVILRSVHRELEPVPSRRRVKFPLIRAKEKRKLRIDETKIDELFFG